MRPLLLTATIVLTSGTASAGDWKLFRRADPGPGTGWVYHGLDSGPYITSPPCTGKGCGVAPPVADRAFWPGPGPRVPVYGPIPGMLNTSDLYRGFPTSPGLGWYGPLTPSPRPRTAVQVAPNTR